MDSPQNDTQIKLAFIKGAEGRLEEIKKAVEEVERQLKSNNENAIKLAVSWTKICHDFMLKEAPKSALAMLQTRPVYPH